jgi:DEAD/DEAH box helicase domain-containing protein
MTCNASDLGTECANPHETRGIPDRILLYDKHPGGIGIALQIKSLFGELLLAALELVSECNCTSSAGCPNCIQVSSNAVLNSTVDGKKHLQDDKFLFFFSDTNMR